MDNLFIDMSAGEITRSSLYNFCAFLAFISHIELKSHLETLNNSDWINAMQDELHQFERNQV